MRDRDQHGGDAASESIAELRHQLYKLKQAHKFTIKLAQAPDLETSYIEALEAISELLECKHILLLVAMENGDMAPAAVMRLSKRFQQAFVEYLPWPADTNSPMPFFAPDLSLNHEDNRLFREASREKLGSLACWPLVYQEFFLGALLVCFQIPHPFTPLELDLAQIITEQLSLTIGRQLERNRFPGEKILPAQAEHIAQLGTWSWDVANSTFHNPRYFGPVQDVTEQVNLHEKLLRQTEILQALEKMGHAVTSTFDRQVIFQEVLANLMELLGAEGVFILLLQGEELVFVAGNQTGNEDLTGNRILANTGVAGQVIASGKPQALFGDEARQRTFEDFVRALGYQPGALLVAPLRLRGNLIGVLEAMHHRSNGLSEEDLPILEAAASWTAIAIQNAGLVRQLSISRDRLRLLARRVVNVQEQERRRISRELHDEAGQALTALKISLGIIQKGLAGDYPDINAQVHQAIHTTDQTMEQIRRLAQGLHPPVLEKLGLAIAAEALCADFAKQANLDIRTDIRSIPDLDSQSAISLYRVLQEGLTNAVKHANPSVITVSLSMEEDEVMLVISDDGQGFKASEQISSTSSGLGLAGMQERVELLGGKFQIDSELGLGTLITARIPSPKQPEEE